MRVRGNSDSKEKTLKNIIERVNRKIIKKKINLCKNISVQNFLLVKKNLIAILSTRAIFSLMQFYTIVQI